jgi:hypothetical protein
MEKGRKLISASLLCGLVTLFACIPSIGGYYKGNAAWGLTAGILTFISSLVILQKYDDINIQMMKLYGAIMFVIWATVAGVLTFDGPFVATGKFVLSFFSIYVRNVMSLIYFTMIGNGYFATWGGFIVAIFFANHQFSREDEIV